MWFVFLLFLSLSYLTTMIKPPRGRHDTDVGTLTGCVIFQGLPSAKKVISVPRSWSREIEKLSFCDLSVPLIPQMYHVVPERLAMTTDWAG